LCPSFSRDALPILPTKWYRVRRNPPTRSDYPYNSSVFYLAVALNKSPFLPDMGDANSKTSFPHNDAQYVQTCQATWRNAACDRKEHTPRQGLSVAFAEFQASRVPVELPHGGDGVGLVSDPKRRTSVNRADSAFPRQNLKAKAVHVPFSHPLRFHGLKFVAECTRVRRGVCCRWHLCEVKRRTETSKKSRAVGRDLVISGWICRV
jgi:hypothetical protein